MKKKLYLNFIFILLVSICLYLNSGYNLADYTKCGGAPLLGVNKIVLKCHGNSKAPIVADTIQQAYELARNKLVEKVAKAVEKSEE